MVMFIALTTSVSAATYVVKDGDVLWKIAKENNTSVEAIVEENELSNPNLIYSGQVLKINEAIEPTITDPVESTDTEGFRVTIIGSGLPQLSLDKIGPSTLVEFQDKKFLVDCGFESMTGLMKVGLQPGEITNMLFTHQHVDHNADFTTFFIGGWEEESMTIDGVKITAIQVPHTITTYAYKFEAGGQTVVVSGDMSQNEQIVDFAKGADIFVVDALLAADFSDVPEAIRETLRQNLSKAHISNPQIGELLAEANPKNDILTHWFGSLTLQDSIDLYQSAGYEGNVIKGVDGLVFE
jgi:ribonuclease BN (tRNA processing enzyme)